MSKASQSTEKTVQLKPNQVRAAFVSNSFNATERTIEVVWSTGSRGARFDWEIGRYYEELSMQSEHVNLERLNLGASVLNSHRSYDLADVIGAVVPGSAVVDGKEGRATLKLSEREEIAGIVKDIEAGIIRHISVGYNVSRYELVDKVQEGEDLIPVYRAVDWEPAELSFVPIAFDAKAQARSAEGEKNPESSGVKCVFVNRGVAANVNGGSNMEKTPEQIAAEKAEQARREQEQAAQQRAAGAAALRQLMSDVRSAVAVLPEGERAAVEAELIADETMTADRARATVIEKLAKGQAVTRNTNTTIETVEDARDKFIRGASSWMIQRSGAAQSIGEAGKNLEVGEFRGLSMMELARMCLERAGVNARGMDKMDLVGRALTFRSGMNTTSDFALLLENVMHKIMQGAYSVTPDTWRRFCGTGTVSDFRDHQRYLMGSFGSLDSLNENGEFKRKQIPDGAKESIKAGTKGNTIAISRQSIINDDMNAFASLATMFGRAAKLSIEKDVYAFLALNGGLGGNLRDGNSLFHAAHNNIGAGAALSVASIDADRVLMATQKDISGNEILDLKPAVLLVPASLGGQARVINQAQYDTDAAVKSQVPNKVAGLYSDIVDTGRLTGTRRYSFADPQVAPVIEVAFLDGQQEPVLETKDGWNIDGTEMKVRIDYAVGGVGSVGATTNAGA